MLKTVSFEMQIPIHCNFITRHIQAFIKQENQIHQLQICILHKLTKTFTIYRIFSIFKGEALKYISLILFLDTNINISTALVYKTNRLGE
ncbi:hypothetical protein BKK45_15580 [Bacillus cereus]|nr:hypothetical protein BKK45_15580 [Bacillus cereus]